MDRTIKNPLELRNMHVMALEHLVWIIQDGLDNVANASQWVNFKGAPDYVVAQYCEQFLGKEVINLIRSLADGSLARFFDLMVEHGVMGYAVYGAARHYKFAGADEAINVHLAQNGTSATHSEFNYEAVLRDLMDGDVSTEKIEEIRKITEELAEETARARTARTARPGRNGPDRRKPNGRH